MILGQLKAYGWMAAAIALAVLLGTQTWRLHLAQLEVAATTTQLANERAAAAVELAEAQAAARNTETKMNTVAAETRKETHDQVRTLTTQRNALLDRVRRAEARAAAAQLPQASATACSGAPASGDHGSELLATIGTADVEEANRADTLRLHLLACYRQYDAAREALSAQ